jgi:hypothetical protein
MTGRVALLPSRSPPCPRARKRPPTRPLRAAAPAPAPPSPTLRRLRPRPQGVPPPRPAGAGRWGKRFLLRASAWGAGRLPTRGGGWAVGYATASRCMGMQRLRRRPRDGRGAAVAPMPTAEEGGGGGALSFAQPGPQPLPPPSTSPCLTLPTLPFCYPPRWVSGLAAAATAETAETGERVRPARPEPRASVSLVVCVGWWAGGSPRVCGAGGWAGADAGGRQVVGEREVGDLAAAADLPPHAHPLPAHLHRRPPPLSSRRGRRRPPRHSGGGGARRSPGWRPSPLPPPSLTRNLAPDKSANVAHDKARKIQLSYTWHPVTHIM